MGPLTVAERGVFGAGRVEWEVGMFGWASRGGRMAQPVWEGSGGQMSQSSNSWGRDWSNTNSGTGSASEGGWNGYPPRGAARIRTGDKGFAVRPRGRA